MLWDLWGLCWSEVLVLVGKLCWSGVSNMLEQLGEQWSLVTAKIVTAGEQRK
jgi:hypothetical protein